MLHRYEFGDVSPLRDRGVGGIPDEVRIIPDYYLYVAVAQTVPRARGAGSRSAGIACIPAACRRSQRWRCISEVLWLIDKWAGSLDPPTVDARAANGIYTAIALEEMRQRREFCRGFMRLFAQGSPGSQVVRPFMFIFHVARRKLATAVSGGRSASKLRPCSIGSAQTLMPQVSIIMNVRNGAAFLREALEACWRKRSRTGS